jgi:hypothetical protein
MEASIKGAKVVEVLRGRSELPRRLDKVSLLMEAIFASIREKDYVFYWWLWCIIDYKRGRASAAKKQPHREVGTQSHGPRL